MIQSHPGVLRGANMKRILCVAVVLSTLSGPALAGMSEGMAAVTVGDYPKAISEFQPLAAGGDAAAQYQLARIYLEGHGPADGVPQGIELMTKSATGGYPEAQAQLGLMYAMGLGVPADNTKAYDWLTKAIAALPEGTRRTVAEANRDAVLKRMNTSQQAAVAAASKPKTTNTQAATATKAATTKPATTEEVAKKSTAETTIPKATTTGATTTAATTKTKTVTEAPANNKTATAAATTAKPTGTEAAAKTPEKTPEKTQAKTSEATTQVASAKAPEASDTQKAAQSGVRIQLISMPTEDAAWDAWKRLSGKYSEQLSGLTPNVETADLGTKGTFYRVQAGPFGTVAAAQERCSAMKAAGLDCLVVGKP
jgi:uncharacterized protein